MWRLSKKRTWNINKAYPRFCVALLTNMSRFEPRNIAARKAEEARLVQAQELIQGQKRVNNIATFEQRTSVKIQQRMAREHAETAKLAMQEQLQRRRAKCPCVL